MCNDVETIQQCPLRYLGSPLSYPISYMRNQYTNYAKLSTDSQDIIRTITTEFGQGLVLVHRSLLILTEVISANVIQLFLQSFFSLLIICTSGIHICL